MIGKGKSISHTGASIGHGWNQEKDAKVVYSQHLTGENPKEITQEFKIIQSQNQRCTKNTMSFVLSPTIEDGQKLKSKELTEITERFVKEMKLREHQAIAFVHRNKKHVHIHLYVNRISFQGKAYKDSYIGKRSQRAAERVADKMGLTTVREVQQQKLDQVKEIRMILKRMHEKVISETRPKDFDQYIKAMEAYPVKVVPSINRQNRLQGFRFKFAGESLKGSDVHRSMSMGRIAEQIGFDRNVVQKVSQEKSLKLLGKVVNVTPNLAAKIATKVIEQSIKRTIDRGIGIGIGI